MPNINWFKKLLLVGAICLAGNLQAQVKFKVALLPDSTGYQVSMFSEIGPFASALQNFISSASVVIIAPTGQVIPGNLTNQKGFWSGPDTFINPVPSEGRDYFVFNLNGSITDISFSPGLEVDLFSFSNAPRCAGAVELMDNENDPFKAQSTTENVGNQITVFGVGNVNAYGGQHEPRSANCMGFPLCDLLLDSLNSSNVSECGLNNGSITIFTSNEIGTVQYSIDNGLNYQMNNNFTNLAVGNYTIKVKDDNCEQVYANNPVSITEPGLPVSLISSSPPSCNQSLDGSITLSASGGAPPYQYSINNGMNWTTDSVFSNLGNGIFTLVARNMDESCFSQYAGNPLVFATQAIDVQVGKTDVSCSTNAKGSIQIAADGGIGSFEYSIDSGLTWLSTHQHNDLDSGNYFVFVRNSDGSCEQTYENNPVVINEGALNYEVSATQPDCNGGMDGSITVFLAGEAGGFEYSINNGTDWSSDTVFSNLGPENYVVKVRKMDGSCETTYENNPVDLVAAPISVSISTISGFCTDGMTNSITVAASGGTGTFEYSNDDGATWQSANIFSSLGNGDYTIKVRNDDGSCETAYGSNPVSFMSNPISVAVNFTPPTCNNSTNGNILITASGGTGSFIYSIDNGVTYENNANFTGLGNGNYMVKVKNADGSCETEFADNPLSINTLPLNLAISESAVSCAQIVDGSISMLGNGGSGSFQFSIDSGLTWSTNNNYQNLSAGLYSLFIRNADGSCETEFNNNPVDLGADSLKMELLSSTPSSCDNDDGSLVLTAIGGNGISYEFSIDDGLNYASVGTFQNLANGVYNLKVRIPNSGCVIDYSNNPVVLENPSCPDPSNCVIDLFMEESDGVFTVGMIPDISWTAPSNTVSSTQITLRIPSINYELENFTNLIDNVVFEVSSRQNSPAIEEGFDYVSISLNTFGTTLIPFNKGSRVDFFSFQINGACASEDIHLVGEGSPFSFPNGEDDNVTSQMTVLGWGGPDVPVCVSVSGSPLCVQSIAAVLPSAVSFCGASDGAINIFTECIAQGTKFSIDNGQTYHEVSNFTGLPPGNYNVKIKNDSTNCEITYDLNPVVVSAGTPISFTAMATAPTCADSTNGSIQFAAQQGSGSYLYSIDDGMTWSTDAAFSGIGNGNYPLKVSNLDTTCITAYDTSFLTISSLACDLDSDGDGQSDISEDINNDGNLENDDTDMDGTPNYQDPDDDGDGIMTSTEEAGPNNGDGNGDGNPDCLQSDVATRMDNDGAFRTLELTNSTCQMIRAFAIIEEMSTAESDVAYDFPNDLNAFVIQCSETVDIAIYYHNISNFTNFQYRKFGPTTPGGTTPEWYDFPVNTSIVNVGGEMIGKVSFQLTDGQPGDATTADGLIVDPGGLGMAASLLDTLNYTLNFEQRDTICIDSFLQLPNNVGMVSVCQQGANVTATVSNGDSCIIVEANTGFSGMDTLCVLVCDDTTTDFCDTTILFITVEPGDTTPTIVDCDINIEIRDSNGIYIVSMTPDTTIINSTLPPPPSAPNPFFLGPTQVMDITLRAPTGQMQIVNQLDFITGAEFVLSNSIIAPVESPEYDYFTFSLNDNNPISVRIPYNEGQRVDLFTFQNFNCALDSFSLVGHGANFTAPLIGGVDINTKATVNSSEINACVGSKNVVPDLMFTAVGTDPTTGNCMDGRITFIASGSTAFYEYSIDNGISWQIDNRFTDLENGTYQALVRTTDTTCTSLMAQTVTLNNTECITMPICDVVMGSIDSTNVNCSQDDGTITVNATGSNLQYSNDNGVSFQNSNLFENLAIGAYSIIVRDSVETTCRDSVMVNLEGTTLPDITSVSVSDSTEFAANQGIITIFATGSGDLRYSIDGGMNFFSGNSFTNLGIGTYEVIVMNDADTCSVNYNNNPIQITNPCLLDAGEDVTICAGDSVAISATGTGFVYGWVPTVGLSCTDCPNPMASPDTTTTYIVTNSGGGCFIHDTIVVTVNTIDADFNFTTNCADFLANFTDNSTTSANIINWAWDFGEGGNTSTLENPTHTYPSAGDYSVTLRTTIEGGCQDSITKVITIGTGLTTTITPDEVFCVGDCINLMATGGTTYSWDTDTTLSAIDIPNPVACPTQTTTYYVTIDDGNGCQKRDSVILTSGAPTIGLSATNSTCGEANGNITIFSSLPGATLEFQVTDDTIWSSSNVFNDLPSGSYNIRVRKAGGGCVTSFANNPVVLGGNSAPTIDSISTTDLTNCDTANGNITVFASGSNSLIYSIDSGQTWASSNVFADLAAGDYAIQVAYSDTTCVSADSMVQLAAPNIPIILTVTSTNPSTCEGADGTINIEVQDDGLGQFEYSIDQINWQANNVISDLDSGTYVVYVRYQNENCIATYNTPIVLQGNSPTITDVSTTNPSGTDSNDGSIIISVTGGTNFEYSINNGLIFQDSSTFNGLDTGTFNIVVRYPDSTCSVAFNSPIILREGQCLTIDNVASTEPTGCGNNGNITITSTPSTDVEYSINNGTDWQASNQFNNLDAGTYTIFVRRMDITCPADSTPVVVLSGDQLLTIDTVSSSNPDVCSGDVGSITITTTPNANLEYSVDSGVTWQTSNVFDSLAANTYFVFVRTTDLSCVIAHNSSITSTEDQGLNITNVIALDPDGCDRNNGSITITITPNTDVEYSIDSGATWQDNNVFNNLTAATYNIFVRKTDLSCLTEANNPVTLTVGQGLTITDVSSTNPDDGCGNSNGTITVTVTPNTDVEYSIDSGSTWQASNIFNGLGNGTYDIAVRKTDLTCLTNYDTPIVLNSTSVNIIITGLVAIPPSSCNTANGSISIAATGANNLEYTIDDGINWQMESEFTGLDEGVYNIKVRSGNCEVDFSSNPLELRMINAFTVVNEIPNSANCTDSRLPLFVTLSDSIATYQVTDGTIENEVLNGATLTFDVVVNNPINEYSITFFNAEGCEVRETFTIFQALDTEADFVVIEPFCKEMEVRMLFTGTATPMATLDWELDGGILISSSPATDTTPAGNEIVVRWDDEGSRLIKLTVDDGGCIDDEYQSIFVRKLPLVDAGEDVTICMGGCTQLEGSGTGVWYNWEPAAGLSAADIPNPVACPTQTTTYVLMVMSADGCMSIDSVTVSVETDFLVTGSDVTICEGESTTLNVGGGMNYSWSPIESLDNPTSATPIASPTTTTTYTVFSPNPNGCMDTAMVTVFVNPAPEPIACEDKTICRGDSIQLVVTSFPQYEWSPANTLLNPTTGVPIAFPTETTTYIVKVTDENGCMSTDEVVVFVETPPTINASENVTICQGTSTQLSATGGLSYVWSPTTGLNDATIANPIATPLVTTTYTVTGTDARGCTGTDMVTVTVMEGTGITAGTNVTICEGENTQLLAQGGTNYNWSPAIGLSSTTVANPIANPTTTTTYTVTGTGANGCATSGTVTVTVLPKPEAIACEDKTICRGDSIQLIVTTHAQYSWSPTNTLLNPNSGTPTAFPTETTTYSVVVTDENGCTDTDEVTVFVNNPNAVALGPDITMCEGGAVPLDAGPGISYQWSPTTGLNDPNIRNPIANVASTITYTVEVTNADGCIGTDAITIIVTGAPLADAGPQVILCPGETGQLNASGGVTYQWSPTMGLSDPNIANPIVSTNSSTIYEVTVTDENGCTATDETLVAVSLPLMIDPIITDANCCGRAGSATLMVSGGFGNPTFDWSPNVSDSNTATDLAAGFYKVFITDAQGCSIVFTFEIEEDCDSCADMFSEEEKCVSDTATVERLCLPIALEDINRYEILVDGQNYQPDHGCDHENLTAYSYALVEGQGSTGMYLVENWSVNGEMVSTEVETMQELTQWMNTVDPTGNWIHNPSILTIIGGDPNKTYGTMKVVQLTKWIETMLQPDVTGIATGTIVEVDLNTMIRPIEVIITDTTTCCSDTITLYRCGEERPCTEELVPEEEITATVTCGELAEICLSIPHTFINQYDLLVDSFPYPGAITACDYDSMFAFSYFTIPAQGTAGPYRITDWTIDGQMHSGMFNDIPELVQLMNQIDSTGDWKLNAPSFTILGGTPDKDYGPINIEQVNTTAFATIEINANFIPMGTSLSLAKGDYEIQLINKETGCQDRVMVIIACEVTDLPEDTTDMTPPMDTTDMTPPMDTTDMTPPMDTTDMTPPMDTTDMTPPMDTTDMTPPMDTTDMTPPMDTTDMTPPMDTTDMTPPMDTACTDFITAEVVFETIYNCSDSVDFCIDIPFTEIGDYQASIDGLLYNEPFKSCDGQTGVRVGVGGFNFLFEQNETGCRDSIVLAVRCETSPRQETLTIEEGETSTYCPEADDLIGDIISIQNVCPEKSGTHAEIQLDSIGFCLNYEGLLVGDEEACIVLCDEMGVCDTINLLIQVVPRPIQLPLAVMDVDTTEVTTAITIAVLSNDSIFGELRNMEILEQPKNGLAVLNEDRTITYTPNTDYCDTGNPDLIMYGICNDDGCDTAMVAVWVPCSQLEIMNGFSPNNDGVNDFFTIKGIQAFPDNEVQIVNRWGTPVFFQKNYKNRWDGTFKDKVLPDGTYFYILKDGKGGTYSGFVQIRR